MIRIFHRRSPVFWDWLSENSNRIKSTLKQHPAVISAEIGAEFAKSFPTLLWEITPCESIWQFCVSADGDSRFIHEVQRAVQDAPEVPGWQIQAFRPRGPLDGVIEVENVSLSYDDI